MRGTRSGAGFEHPELLCYFIECLIGQSSGNATIDMRGMIWDNIVGNRGQRPEVFAEISSHGYFTQQWPGVPQTWYDRFRTSVTIHQIVAQSQPSTMCAQTMLQDNYRKSNRKAVPTFSRSNNRCRRALSLVRSSSTVM